MQNIYSPNRFYLTFPNDDPLNVDNIVNVIEKLIFTLLENICDFPSFWPDLN